MGLSGFKFSGAQTLKLGGSFNIRRGGAFQRSREEPLKEIKKARRRKKRLRSNRPWELTQTGVEGT